MIHGLSNMMCCLILHFIWWIDLTIKSMKISVLINEYRRNQWQPQCLLNVCYEYIPINISLFKSLVKSKKYHNL